MDVIYAFDRDDTVSTSNGVVPLELVKKLSQNQIVYAIGNQKLCKEADIIGVSDGSKPQKLRRIKRLHPKKDKYIVVDDLNLSDVEGWIYFTPERFVEVSKD